MLALTPAAEYALQWFELTHHLVNDGGYVSYRRVSLPHAGGVGDQDARLMDSLEHVRQVMTQVLAERMADLERKRELDKWRRQRKAGT